MYYVLLTPNMNGQQNMEFEDRVIKELISLVLDKCFNVLSSIFNNEKDKISITQNKLEAGLSIHIKKALKFSDNISVFKAPDDRDVIKNSIQLYLVNQDRRFAPLDSRKTIIEEDDLLNDDFHHLLLGDIGAGKTTTLKRLTRKLFNILFSEKSDLINFSYPIVVRLGEIAETETLFTHICGMLGIEYETHAKIVNYKEVKEERYKDFERVYEVIEDPKTKKKVKIPKDVEVEKVKEVETHKTKTVYEYKMGGSPLKYSVPKYLNGMKCIIFLDGLDEIHFQIKDAIFEDIKELSQTLDSSKIILTSRHIQEIQSFKQFKISEILPLNDDQKREIANIWLKNSDLFFSKIKKLPYGDLTNRPLFLFYLLKLFDNNNENLPPQAIDVYRQIVLLAIREWDIDKELAIRRYSKYRKFDTYKREDFLSELAFELTFSQGVKKVFTHQQLEIAYLNIYSRYPELSWKDEKDIVQDIEAHSGLIIEVFDNKFEFSHLSLQEFLCAKYILSIPMSRKHYELLNIYPAPLAIATTLTPKPEEWFSMLFLCNIGEIRVHYQLESDKIFEYLDRLITEKVHFSRPTIELGFAVMYLFFKVGHTKASQKLVEFTNVSHIEESVRRCLHYYNVEQFGDEYYFEIIKKPITDLHINFPEKGSVKTMDIESICYVSSITN